MTIRFTKMHGAGNDFVMIDDRDERIPTDDPAFLARLANRPDGVGCEGVILVRPARQGIHRSKTALRSKVARVVCLAPVAAASNGEATSRSLEQESAAIPTSVDFTMRFFNPDGSEAELCGNGARCVAAFAYAIGAAKAKTMRFATLAGEIAAEVLDDGRVRLAMPQPKDLRKDFVNSGVPHAIVPVADLAAVNVLSEGRRLRDSEAFAPAGTNVDFVQWTGPQALSIRTYERGVEAETFACGTGSVAAALVGVAQYALAFPVVVTTVRGDRLEIGGAWDGETFSGVTLTGPVKTVFAGELEIVSA